MIGNAIGRVLVVRSRYSEAVFGQRHQDSGQAGFFVAADADGSRQITRDAPFDGIGRLLPTAVENVENRFAIPREKQVVPGYQRIGISAQEVGFAGRTQGVDDIGPMRRILLPEVI